MVAGLLAFATLGLAQHYAPLFFHNLISSPGPLLAQTAAAVTAFFTLRLLQSPHPNRARYTSATQVALVLFGWGMAMDRHFILPDLPIDQAGAQPAALPVLLIALSGGAVVLAPALFYLFHVFKLRRD